MIGGIAETQEMLDFCGRLGITADGRTVMFDIDGLWQGTEGPTEEARLKVAMKDFLEANFKWHVAQDAAELRELAWFYEQKGLSLELAQKVAAELTERDALKAHAEAELGIDSEQHASPGQAAISSFVAFASGSLLPILAVTGPWVQLRIPATVVAVALSLALTGFVGAKIGGAKSGKAIIRNVSVSLLTMGVTYGIGMLFGTATLG